MRFSKIYNRAAKRKGGEKKLNELLSSTGIITARKVAKIPDDRLLSSMTRCVFQAGFNWKVIENMWKGFEEAFWQFNVSRCAYMNPEEQDALFQDKRIVRNKQKIKTVPINALMIMDAEEQYGSFAKMIVDWPDTDFIGLLNYLDKNGSRLGGKTAQYFLRQIGRDGFVHGKDGVAALIDAGVVSKDPTSQSDMRLVQSAYNDWMDETGFGLARLSRILALSIDAH